MKRVQTPFSPTYTSHPIFTKINGLKYITTMNTDELSSKAKGQTAPQSDLYFILPACTHQCLFPLRLLWGSGHMITCFCCFQFLHPPAAFLTTLDNELQQFNQN